MRNTICHAGQHQLPEAANITTNGPATPTFSIVPVSPQSYDIKFPVGTTIRMYLSYLSSINLECMAPMAPMGGKQNRILSRGTLPRISSF